MKLLLTLLGLAPLLLAAPHVVFAQASAPVPQAAPTPVAGIPAPPPPPYRPVRYDEDWTFLRDPKKRTDLWDPVKFVPLNRTGTNYLTVGGDFRERYEYYRNLAFGRGPQDKNGYFLERSLFSTDVHLGDKLRVFTQLNSADVSGRNGGPRPTDRDAVDLQQAFFDTRVQFHPQETLQFRVGRQEMPYGSQRLVSTGEGLNVRTKFDGVRTTLNLASFRIDGFLTRPVKSRTGAFDNGTDDSRLFWGIYATTPLSVLPGGNLDVYYLDLDNRREIYDKVANHGVGREQRRSLGTRLFGKKGAWDYDDEYVYQYGRFGSGIINAFSLATSIGYTDSGRRYAPRFGLKADVASGDRDPKSSSLQTFNALFPAENYFNLSGLAGVRNFVDAHPSVDLHPNKKVIVTGDCVFYWRESLNDGLYSPGSGLIASGQDDRGKYIGTQPGVQIVWLTDRHVTILANYSHFSPGSFLKDAGLNRSVDYFTTWVAYQF